MIYLCVFLVCCSVNTVISNFLGFGRKANGSVRKSCRANGSVGVIVVWNGCDVTIVVGEQQKNWKNYSTWLSFCSWSRFWTFWYSKARKDTHSQGKVTPLILFYSDFYNCLCSLCMPYFSFCNLHIDSAPKWGTAVHDRELEWNVSRSPLVCHPSPILNWWVWRPLRLGEILR